MYRHTTPAPRAANTTTRQVGHWVTF